MDHPYSYRFAILASKSDTVNYLPNTGGTTPIADALWVGGAGVVALVLEDDSVVNITAVAGSLIPVRSKRVNSSNTSATVMTALFR